MKERDNAGWKQSRSRMKTPHKDGGRRVNIKAKTGRDRLRTGRAGAMHFLMIRFHGGAVSRIIGRGVIANRAVRSEKCATKSIQFSADPPMAETDREGDVVA